MEHSLNNCLLPKQIPFFPARTSVLLLITQLASFENVYAAKSHPFERIGDFGVTIESNDLHQTMRKPILSVLEVRGKCFPISQSNGPHKPVQGTAENDNSPSDAILVGFTQTDGSTVTRKCVFEK